MTLYIDPFAGSGTTLNVAKLMYRNSIGIEILPEYVEMAKKNQTEKEFVLFEPKVKYESVKSK